MSPEDQKKLDDINDKIKIKQAEKHLYDLEHPFKPPKAWHLFLYGMGLSIFFIAIYEFSKYGN